MASEKERLKEGAAMAPCGEWAYMAGCEDEPVGKDWEAGARATCMLVPSSAWVGAAVRRCACGLRAGATRSSRGRFRGTYALFGPSDSVRGLSCALRWVFAGAGGVAIASPGGEGRRGASTFALEAETAR